MLIDQYCSETAGQIVFSRQQASDFAKDIADDFNPLHDIDAKKFCVPGDLLFSLVLSRYGISQHMAFSFSGMVSDNTALNFPEASTSINITDNNNKPYMAIERSGDNTTNPSLIDSLTASYVSFSGKTFPHILIPLLEQQQVMINPARPMVIYESMLIALDSLDTDSVELALDQQRTTLETSGKRGKVCLAFNLLSAGKIIGRGEKHMVLSGLKPLDKPAADALIADYNQRKKAYKS